MKKIDACKLRRKGGFTLVELIVVLVLLAVLSAVAVPTYLGFVDDNKAKQCETHRKALASRLEEMSAMGSIASLTEEVLNSDENGCPAGGRYELDDSPEGSDINSMTITCDKHGSTTVMLKNNSQVTAKSNTETEKKGEKQTDPPAPETPKEKISVSLSPCSLYVGDTHTMVPNVTPNTECTYSWSVTSGSEYATIDSASGVVTGNAVGEATVTCIATPVDDSQYESGSAAATVTVNAKPSLSISVTPNSISDIEVGSKITLTASKNEKNCSVNNWNWNTSDWNTVKINDGWNTPSIVIEPQKVGLCNITCQATAKSNSGGSDIQSNTVTISVQVKGKETDVHTINERIVEGTQGVSQQNIYLPSIIPEIADSGVWSSEDSRVNINGRNAYIDDEQYPFHSSPSNGNSYTVIYTLNNEKYIIPFRIVYTCFTFQQTGFGNSINMKKDDVAEIGIQYGPHYTTDSITWSISQPNIIEVTEIDEAISGKIDANCKQRIKAVGVGTTQITVSVIHDNKNPGYHVYDPITWTINVTDEQTQPTNPANPTSSAEIQGHKFGSASWDELKNYLTNPSGTTAESTVINSVFVAHYQYNPDHYYVLRPGVDLSGLNISDDIAFENFIEQRGDLFCEINQYNGSVTWRSYNNNVNRGQIIEKDGVYYIYIGDHLDMNPNSEWKAEDYVQLFLMD